MSFWLYVLTVVFYTVLERDHVVFFFFTTKSVSFFLLTSPSLPSRVLLLTLLTGIERSLLSRLLYESKTKSLRFDRFLHELKLKILKENIERIKMDLKEQSKAIERLKRDVRQAMNNQEGTPHIKVEALDGLLSEMEVCLGYGFDALALVLMVSLIRSVFYLFTLRQKSLSWPVCIARSFALASHDLCMADGSCFTEATWSNCSTCTDGSGLFIVASFVVSRIKHITYHNHRPEYE